MDDKSKTTISLFRGTKRRLHNFGRMEETYDDLLNRLLDEIKECRNKSITNNKEDK